MTDDLHASCAWSDVLIYKIGARSRPRKSTAVGQADSPRFCVGRLRHYEHGAVRETTPEGRAVLGSQRVDDGADSTVQCAKGGMSGRKGATARGATPLAMEMAALGRRAVCDARANSS